jgi:hypothetical protein
MPLVSLNSTLRRSLVSTIVSLMRVCDYWSTLDLSLNLLSDLFACFCLNARALFFINWFFDNALKMKYVLHYGFGPIIRPSFWRVVVFGFVICFGELVTS